MTTQRIESLRTRFRVALSSRIAANIFSLYVVRGFNYLLPLLVLPYLLRVLGPRTYGGIAFAQSLMTYAVILTDFGFSLSATRAISLARDDPGELAQIFWTTITAKATLLLVCTFIIVSLFVFLEPLRAHEAVISLCGLSVIGSVALPQWYFQGIERMRTMAWIQAASKIIGLLPIFIFVHSSQDQLLAAAILSMPAMIGGILCFVAVKYIAPVSFYRPKWRDIRKAYSDSRHFFLSTVATSAYVTGNGLILGLVSGDAAVAFYSVANKAALAAFGLFTPVIQAVFPRSSFLFGRSLPQARIFVRQVAAPLLTISALISSMLFLFAHQVITLLGGSQYAAATSVLRVMAFLPTAVCAATLLAQLIMINIGLARTLSHIYVFMGLLSFVLLPLLAHRFGALGGAMALMTVETLGPVLMLIAIWKSRQFWKDRNKDSVRDSQ